MRITAILADDHAIFRQGLASLLDGVSGVELLAEAADGAEALTCIRRLRPDVAIVDVNMPQVTGTEVACRVQAEALDTRVVLLTMYDHPAAALHALEAGAAGYVPKDSSLEELVLALQTVAAGGTFISSAIRARLRSLQRSGQTPAGLSPREREVIRLIALGKSSKEAAKLLGISPRTVDTHRNRVMAKLELHSLADVVRYAMQAGIVTHPSGTP